MKVPLDDDDYDVEAAAAADVPWYSQYDAKIPAIDDCDSLEEKASLSGTDPTLQEKAEADDDEESLPGIEPPPPVPDTPQSTQLCNDDDYDTHM